MSISGKITVTSIEKDISYRTSIILYFRCNYTNRFPVYISLSAMDVQSLLERLNKIAAEAGLGGLEGGDGAAGPDGSQEVPAGGFFDDEFPPDYDGTFCSRPLLLNLYQSHDTS